MVERVALAKENARLSMRPQELYQQVKRVENQRIEIVRLFVRGSADKAEIIGPHLGRFHGLGTG
jgi:hypothetical protein